MDMSSGRRAWLKMVARATGAAVALPFIGRVAWAAPAKVTKAIAHYQNHPDGPKMCGRCHYFVPAGGVAGHGMGGVAMGPAMMRAGRCQVVQGSISPRGYCLLYQPL